MNLVTQLLTLAVCILLVALVFALPIYAGWNWGVLEAFPDAKLGQLSLFGSFCVSVLLHTVANAFDNTLKLNTTK